MSVLAITWVPLVHVQGVGDESNIAYEVLVRGNDARLAEMLHLDDILGLL